MTPTLRGLRLSILFCSMAVVLSAQPSPMFNWAHIKPSTDLIFHDCYWDLQCARLQLPLDWKAKEESLWNETVAIAIIKLPAVVSPLDPRYGGAIFTNPGGPSGSGVDFVLRAGRKLQRTVDSIRPSHPHEGKSFDILSFDPRGVMFSTPNAQCFSDSITRDVWRLKLQAGGVLDSSPIAVPFQSAMSTVLGAVCSSRESAESDDPQNIRAYMTTASVARDMLDIVDRLEELKEKSEQMGLPSVRFTQESALWRLPRVIRSTLEGFATPSKRTESQSVLTHSDRNAIWIVSPSQHRERRKVGIKYWGFSYGTFLGTTFASMYPDRIERMVLDGVVDAPNYAEALWSDNLKDTEKVVASLYQTCYNAGPSKCPLYDAEGPEAMQNRVMRLLVRLRDEPIPAIVQSDDGTRFDSLVLTYSDIKTLFFRALYDPIRSFPGIAAVLAGLEVGDYRLALELLGSESTVECSKSADARNSAAESIEVGTAILCSDGDDLTGRTPEEFRSYLHYLDSQSPMVGSIWAMITLQCQGWKVRPRWRYSGPFEGNTSTPILWIGNTADPVTPLANAHLMSSSFPRSVVLTQDSPGHCSLAAPSVCTTRVLRTYFANGIIPEGDKICPADRAPFERDVQEQDAMAESDDRALEAFYDMVSGHEWRRQGER